MRFALLVYGNEEAWRSLSDADKAAIYAQHGSFGTWLAEKGWDRGGEELHGGDLAKTVRKGGGGSIVSDGPFAETKEQLGGFYLIECGSMEEALEAAARVPADVVEVRPVVGVEERPS